MKWIMPFFIGCALLGIALGVTGGIRSSTVTFTSPRTAVDLAFVVERDADDKITKIHRFILWSDGSVTFPNLPYYADLRLNCRDCPKVQNTCPADLNGNGVVDVGDLLIINAAMGKKCP